MTVTVVCDGDMVWDGNAAIPLHTHTCLSPVAAVIDAVTPGSEWRNPFPLSLSHTTAAWLTRRTFAATQCGQVVLVYMTATLVVYESMVTAAFKAESLHTLCVCLCRRVLGVWCQTDCVCV